MKRDIILSGVGGQGILSIATVIGRAALAEGLQIKQAEVHGMSQRGGSVSTQVRFGKKVYSPIIGEGSADILISFEEMEAARYAKFLKKDGKMVVNKMQIPSLPILSGACSYPEGILEELQKRVPITIVDATKIATDLGNPKSANVVLLGSLIGSLGLHNIDWKAIIAKVVKPAFVDINLKAFDAGMAAV